MALISPGIEVTVSDESQYLPAATNSVPYILIATAQDKVQGTSSSVALGTLAENANKLYLVTSQRDLATVFGNPFFYKTTAGTPINGYELNEYGLMAAYSALGVTNRAYVQRVDVDLAALVGTLTRPTGAPVDGVYWLDTESTRWGIFEFDQATVGTSTGGFELKTPAVFTDLQQAPGSNVGSIGDYAILASQVDNTLFYKAGSSLPMSDSKYNTWVSVGSENWVKSWGTAISASVVNTIGANGVMIINGSSVSISSTDSATDISSSINGQFADLTGVVNDKVYFYSDANVRITSSYSVKLPLELGSDGQFTMESGSTLTANANSYSVTFTLSSVPAGAAMGDTCTITGATATGFNLASGRITNVVAGTITVSGYNAGWPGFSTADVSTATLTLTSGAASGQTAPLAGITAVGATPGATVTLTFNDVVDGLTQSSLAVGTGYYLDITTPGSLPNYPDAVGYGLAVAGTTGRTLVMTISNPSPQMLEAAGTGTLQPTYTATLDTTIKLLPERTFQPPVAVQQPHTQVPGWNSTDPRPSGSLWNKITSVNNGELLSLRRYDSAQSAFVTQAVPLYNSDAQALKNLDPAGGGRNILAGSTYALTNPNADGIIGAEILRRYSTGATVVTAAQANPTFNSGDQFYIAASIKGNDTMPAATIVTMPGTTAADFVTAITSAGISTVTATVNSGGYIQLTHTEGGVIQLYDAEPVVGVQNNTAVSSAGFIPSSEPGGVINVRYAPGAGNYTAPGVFLTNWIASPVFTYTVGATGPDANPLDGTLWYYSTASQVDIMINTSSGWRGYRNVSMDARGYDLRATDPNGPIISATRPTLQTDGTPLVPGDLWIDTSDLDNYPLLYRYETTTSGDRWVQIDTADQTTQNGIIFADARWATSGDVDPVAGALPSIAALTISDYLDIDAPDYTLYPTGALLFNTRRSGFNVKRFAVDYFTLENFPNTTLPTYTSTWVTASGNQTNGAAYMGRRAQRSMVIQALRSGLDTAVAAREDANPFNIIACPGYPELIPNMVVLNNDRNQTSFIIGDTPLRLAADGTTLLNYATNADTGAGIPEDNIISGDPYVAVYYPQGQTNDTTGSTIVVPSSHMMLRTYIRSDQNSYPWFAPAGTRRGVIDNATAIGYVDATTGEFVQTRTGQAVRDVLYENQINPITFIPGVGITAYGQKTRYGQNSALDRVNVARLVVYLRQRLQQAVQSFLFEPNDAQTRSQVASAVTSLLIDIVAKRGIYDYLVVCDETNNTPARIDRNELYVDIAIEPAKAIEFIYIPIRLRNTGAIQAAGAGIQG